jgi:3-deoxy-D-manno-octulosonic-acid transferase
MFTFLYALIFNLLVFPVLFLAYHLVAIFNSKYRRGVIGRYRSFKKAAEFLKTLDQKSRDIYLIHCSSMGEFEHIKPFIREFKNRLPRGQIVIMFFSPSGYENVKSEPGVDLFIYAPFDGWFIVRKLFKRLRPRALIIAKYDVWPNQIWTARSMGIPRVLINATLYSSSGRLRPVIRWFQRAIYQKINLILTISDKDKENYRMLSSPEKIVVVGDTKYDQVVSRSEESRKKIVLPENIRAGKQVLVAGSTWPEDEAQLIPAVRNLFSCFQEQMLTVICPHEPTSEHIRELAETLQPLTNCLYSRLNDYKGEQIIIIDRIGLLANLYSVAQVAYVGGSFKQNVHNVLEPAVYGIPVIFGPVNQNSHEAQLLKQRGGGIEVTSAAEIESELRRVFEDETYCFSLSRAAKKLVEENQGATRRTVNEILSYLKI